ncbi:unnamed protein product [Leptidea sinapis]|uniref:Uncharacterized protein n=1 Tax=Leptidea sinapis TaxID=189913 RepID=A0A5E4PS72_9NEOP|nr:unnamed protein product [Leptidea sinapis]
MKFHFPNFLILNLNVVGPVLRHGGSRQPVLGSCADLQRYWSPHRLDSEALQYAVSSGGHYPASWLYLLPEMPRDAQVAVNKRMSRPRRTIYVSVNPAVELLQRGAYRNFAERQAHTNRDFLNCIGKRDPWSNGDCKLKMVTVVG